MKRLILFGLAGAIAVGCVLGAMAPSCWNGVACLAAASGQPADLARAATLAAVAGSLVVASRAAWTTLQLRRALRQLPRGAPRPELERHGVEYITSAAPSAFCAGALRPRVYITDSLVQLLNPLALAAVIAHERAHARRRDPLRRSLLAALSDVLINAPWVLWFRHRQRVRAEVSADRMAAAQLGPYAVADALTTLAIAADEHSAETARAGPPPVSPLRPIVASVVATLAVAVMLLCLSQAVLVLSGARLPHS